MSLAQQPARTLELTDPATLGMLDEKAKRAADHAYCRYSDFPVGAALLTEDGYVFTGCNVENASYGLTVCAERNAVFAMAGAGKRELALLVVYTPTPEPSAPCGACRQVINEFGPAARVRCVCQGARIVDTTLDQLLPTSFGPGNLRS